MDKRNHDIRILELDQIVQEVMESKEWEAVQMDILEIGLEEGIEQGIERSNLLVKFLAKDGRMEDIIKAANDREYQDRLFEEYNL